MHRHFSNIKLWRMLHNESEMATWNMLQDESEMAQKSHHYHQDKNKLYGRRSGWSKDPPHLYHYQKNHQIRIHQKHQLGNPYSNMTQWGMLHDYTKISEICHHALLTHNPLSGKRSGQH